LEHSDKPINDPFPEYLKKRYDLCDKEYAVKNIHFPASDSDFFYARKRLFLKNFF
jgi:ATP-dependent DNA helicase RecG